MGLILGFDTITGEKVPYWFSRTDSKDLQGQLWGYMDYVKRGGYRPEDNYFGMAVLLKYLDMDLSLLLNIAEREEEEPIESFVARDPNDKERPQLWHKLHDERIEREERSWQDPELLINAIKPFLRVLDENPNIYARIGITDQYFINGYFRSDIEDLLRIFEWAKSRNIEKVQINLG